MIIGDVMLLELCFAVMVSWVMLLHRAPGVKTRIPSSAGRALPLTACTGFAQPYLVQPEAQ